MTFGKRLIAETNQLLKRLRHNEPIKQSVHRKLIVNGKNVWVRSVYTAPLRKAKP